MFLLHFFHGVILALECVWARLTFGMGNTGRAVKYLIALFPTKVDRTWQPEDYFSSPNVYDMPSRAASICQSYQDVCQNVSFTITRLRSPLFPRVEQTLLGLYKDSWIKVFLFMMADSPYYCSEYGSGVAWQQPCTKALNYLMFRHGLGDFHCKIVCLSLYYIAH